ncbi:transglycosylase SLT domain-containing protein [Brachymonas sp. G13]|uniref:transglycosylase SLT domain-containing protein n=1 Tax=Brachymonas wangyanguii TaxID=3130163 RepID=UPI00307DF103
MPTFRYLCAALMLVLLAGCASTSQTSSTGSGLRVPDLDRGRTSLGLNNPNNVWDRLRQGFAMPDLDNATVRDRESWYTRNPASIQRLIGSSDKYIYHVIEALESRNMPTEIALLPYVESSFNPLAVSSAKAAGMWQFMPATGRQYELHQNLFLDNRRDVVQSTRAALDYLQRLYNMFGDWHLALAAYNWGEGNVQRAIRRNQAAGRGTSYSELTMPQETRQYVPKLQALKNIVRNPATFNTALPNIANHPYFDQVRITRDMDASIVARMAGISLDDFRALNPSLNRPLVIASLTPTLLLPWQSAPRFRQNLANARDEQLASWTVWTVPADMSVAEVARQHGADEEELRSINRIPSRMRVRSGSTLLVPRQDHHADEISPLVARSGSISFLPEVALQTTSLKAEVGDTIASFAERFGLPVSSVASWNNASPNTRLGAGQEVTVQLPRQQASQLLRQQQQAEAAAERRAREAEERAAERRAREAEERAAAERRTRQAEERAAAERRTRAAEPQARATRNAKPEAATTPAKRNTRTAATSDSRQRANSKSEETASAKGKRTSRQEDAAPAKGQRAVKVEDSSANKRASTGKAAAGKTDSKADATDNKANSRTSARSTKAEPAKRNTGKAARATDPAEDKPTRAKPAADRKAAADKPATEKKPAEKKQPADKKAADKKPANDKKTTAKSR